MWMQKLNERLWYYAVSEAECLRENRTEETSQTPSIGMEEEAEEEEDGEEEEEEDTQHTFHWISHPIC